MFLADIKVNGGRRIVKQTTSIQNEHTLRNIVLSETFKSLQVTSGILFEPRQGNHRNELISRMLYDCYGQNYIMTQPLWLNQRVETVCSESLIIICHLLF